jgi:HEAT repeat protein
MNGMALLPLVVLLAAAPTWRAEVLSDAPEVRSVAIAHLHAKGRAGLYAIQNLVETSTDDADRVRAVRALGELRDPEAEWELRIQLKQPSPHVVAAAVHAVQLLKLPGVAHAVAEKVGDPDAELCEALGEAARLYPAIAENAQVALDGDESRQLAGLRVLNAAGLTIPSIVASRLATSPLAEVRLAAAESLRASDPDAAMKIVVDLLPGPLADEAVDALGRIATPKAMLLLKDLLEQQQPTTHVLTALARSAAGERILIKRRAALQAEVALAVAIDAAIEAQPRTPDLLHELLSDSDDVVANTAALHLGQHPAGVAALQTCLEHLAPEASHCAVGLAGSPGASAEVERALQSLDPGVRALMVAALGETSNKPFLAVLVQMTTDPSPDVRVALATCAGRLGPRGSEILMTLVHDGQPNVRTAAARELVADLPVEGLKLLASEAVGDPALRVPLFAVLGRLPIKDALHLVRASLQDPSVPERRQAMLAMAQFRDVEAVNVLMDSAAKETDPGLRELAYSMLANQ